MEDRYFNPHQAREREPTVYENLLGDALEACFAAGVHDLDSIVARLNEAQVLSPSGSPWTAELFQTEFQRLGA